MYDDSYKQLAKQWIESRPKIKPWLDKNKKEMCNAIGMLTGDEELIVILMRLSDPTSWPDAIHWREYKDDLGRARDRVLHPFLRGEAVEASELRIAVGMLVSQFNQACETIYYLRRNAMRHRPIPRSR
jgi:hypothetical protein